VALAQTAEAEVGRAELAVVAQLAQFGFGLAGSRLAAAVTRGLGVEAAMEWLLANPEQAEEAEAASPQLAGAAPDTALDLAAACDDGGVEPALRAMGFEAADLARWQGASGAAGTAEEAITWLLVNPAAGADAAQVAAAAAEADDFAIARALYEQQIVDHDRDVEQRELLDNRRRGLGGRQSTVKISYAAQRLGPAPQRVVARAPSEDPDDEEGVEQLMERVSAVFDPQRKVWKDSRGQVLTKHNRALSQAANRGKIMALTGVETGDLDGDLQGLGNKVTNSLKVKSSRGATRGGSSYEKPLRGKELSANHGGRGVTSDGLRVISAGEASSKASQGGW